MRFRIDLKILFFLTLFYLTGQLKMYLIIMLFALLHEISHLVVGLILQFKPQAIEIMPFGFSMKLLPKHVNNEKKILKANIIELKYIFVALAGPIFNLVVAIALYKFDFGINTVTFI